MVKYHAQAICKARIQKAKLDFSANATKFIHSKIFMVSFWESGIWQLKNVLLTRISYSVKICIFLSSILMYMCEN